MAAAVLPKESSVGRRLRRKVPPTEMERLSVAIETLLSGMDEKKARMFLSQLSMYDENGNLKRD